MKPPLIIIGMHRSGTSLVAKVLEKAGVFMGVLKDHNYEAMHFLSLNQQSLWAAGADWLSPCVPPEQHWKVQAASALYKEHFKLNGKLQSLRYKMFPQDWGWKDPRNTFTLPMWLSVFPNARVLYIKRAPQDVAKSLQKRNAVPGEVFNERLNDLDFCLALTEKYQEQAAHYAPSLKERFFKTDYEKLVALDRESITQLEGYCGRSLWEHFNTYVR